MKFAKLLHNPGAGDGDHSMEELASKIESAGFNCSYSSTKKSKKLEITQEDYDFVVLAGGDGTVRKIAHKLLEEHLPIGLLPMGTANNIAKTLGISGDAGNIIHSWKKSDVKLFDIGKIEGLEDPKIFLEGFGFGVFPALISEMKKRKKDDITDPEERMMAAAKVLYDIIQSYKAVSCKVLVSGEEYSGKFLLAEVMNIRSIGPNLNLAPEADPGDGEFEIVLIAEHERDTLLRYLSSKIKQSEEIPSFKIIKAKHLQILWEGLELHVDDEYITLSKPAEIQIELQQGVLQFLIPTKVAMQ